MAGKQLAAAGALGLVLAQGVNAFGGGADTGKLDKLVQEHGDVPEVRLFMEEVAKAPEAIQMVLNEGEECKTLKNQGGIKTIIACRKLARKLEGEVELAIKDTQLDQKISELTQEDTKLGKIESEQGKRIEVKKVQNEEQRKVIDALLGELVVSTRTP